MRVLELFAGYGSQALALENLGIEFTSDISEIDRYAIQAYEQLHGATHNWGDICKIDETQLPYYDLITYSSPCQDFSVAGLGKGGDIDSGTRSSLLWQCERIIRAVKPKYLLMENVKNLVGEKHKHNFIKWLKVLESLGYQNFWKVLNAKDYGVPQNRERVFVVSILGGGQYLFPNPIKLEKRLKDVLESNVDEKYYLSDKLIKGFLARAERKDSGFAEQGINIRDKNNVASALTARMSKCAMTDNYIQEPIALDEQNKCLRTDGTVGTLTTDGSSPKHNNRVIEPQVINPLAGKTKYGWHFEQEVYDDNGIARAVKAGGGSGNIPKVIQEPFNLYPNSGNPQAGRVYNADGISPKHNNRVIEPLRIREATQKGYAEAYDGDSVTLDEPNSQTRRGRVGKQMSNTLTTTCNIGVVKKTDSYRIRKLTPRECWRLMGVKDEQFDKLHDLSNTQLYKLAGNSIVVDVLMGIFKNLLLSDEGTNGQLTLL